MEVITKLQQELNQLRNRNEHSLKAREEQERMIRELNANSYHRSIKTKGMKRKKVEAESPNYESRAELDRTYLKSKKEKMKIMLQGEFRKIKPPTFDGEREEDREECLINMITYIQVYE